MDYSATNQPANLITPIEKTPTEILITA